MVPGSFKPQLHRSCNSPCVRRSRSWGTAEVVRFHDAIASHLGDDGRGRHACGRLGHPPRPGPGNPRPATGNPSVSAKAGAASSRSSARRSACKSASCMPVRRTGPLPITTTATQLPCRRSRHEPLAGQFGQLESLSPGRDGTSGHPGSPRRPPRGQRAHHADLIGPTAAGAKPTGRAPAAYP